MFILTDYCPEYNSGANALDIVPCNVSYGCPDVSFMSNKVYQCKNAVHLSNQVSPTKSLHRNSLSYHGVTWNLWMKYKLIMSHSVEWFIINSLENMLSGNLGQRT